MSRVFTSTSVRLSLGLGLTLAACGPAPSLPATSAPPPASTATRSIAPHLRAQIERLAVADRTLATERLVGARTPVASARTPRLDVPLPTEVTLPDLSALGLYSTGGSAAIASNTLPGTGSFSGAPVADMQGAPPATVGAGAYDVTAAGSVYASTLAESVAYTFTDQSPSGATLEYLVLGAWTVTTDPLTGADVGGVLYVVTPRVDFVPGASVAFDGVDRFALYYGGDLALPEPEYASVSVSGAVTFIAGGTNLGDLIDASVAGDFADLVLTPAPPPPPPGPSAITAGTYDLTYSPAPQVYCDGTLIGQESAFAGVTLAAVGFADGVVTLALPASGGLELLGVSGFGAGPVALQSDPSAPPGLYFATASASGVGPLSTDLVANFLLIDESTATSAQVLGGAGVGFVTADQLGFCQVGFDFVLTP